MQKRKRTGFKIMTELIKVVKPLRKYMMIAVTCGTLSFLFYTAISVLATNLLFSYITKGIGSSAIVKIMIASVILRGLFRYLEQYMNHLIAFKVLALLRNKVFFQIRKLAPAKIESMNKGDLISVISADMELLEVFYAHTISPICIAIITSIIYVIYVATIFPLGAMILFIGYISIGIILPIIFAKFANSVSLGIRKNIGKINNSFLDLLRGISEIITFSYQKKAIKIVDDANKNLKENQDKLIKNLAFLLGIIDFLELLVTALIILSGIVLKVSTYQIFISSVAAFFSFGAVRAVAMLGNGLAQTLSCGDRVLDILEEKPIVEEITDKTNLNDEIIEKNKEKLINIENLTFGYNNSKILENINLTIKKGEIIGIQGASGCGKSTLLKLIMHFWNVDNGMIEIASKNILDINTKSLYSNISYMTQTTEFFEGSIRDNLLIAKPDATDDEIREALKKASILDYVENLKDGLDTFIKELGDNFSGGERQRIGLARCFLKDAPILLLDEPTSNLDALNESIILKSIVDNMKEKTIILVSHRTSTLRISNRIIQMKSRNSER